MIESGMRTGIGFFPTHDAVGPDVLARIVEDRGHDALFFAEHSHIPASRDSPTPITGGELPRRYAHTHDLFVAMTAAAMATRRLRVGSGVCLIIERDPITTAKQVASIDQLSGGRVEFGIGAGWNLEEMANHGTDPRERFAVFGERIEAMKSMWTEDEATYHGQHVNFERIWIWPKPTQRPYPPILVGGHGKRVLERVHSYGDGWMATHRAGAIDRINELRAGDTDRRMTVTVSGVPADPRVLDMYAAAGVDRVNFWVPSAPRGPVERALDEYERAIAEHRGE